MNKFCFGLLLWLSVHCVSAYAEQSAGFFVKSEAHENDYIHSIGAQVWLTGQHSPIGFALNTSLGKAKVTDTFNYQHDYIAWDFGARFGYFSDIFVYGEVGFDLAELMFRQRHEQDYDEYEHNGRVHLGELLGETVLDNFYRDYDKSNDVDAFIGVGAGVRLSSITIEAFSKYRQIDGEHWKAENQVYHGVKLSLMF